MKFISPTWDEILVKSIEMAERIRKTESFRFDCIVGVSRGGLALARIMSDLLDVQDIMIVRCEYYSDIDKKKERPVITQKIQGTIRGRNVLVVDDVSDSGESLLLIKKYLHSKSPKNLKVAATFVKPWSKLMPDYFTGSTESWIIFPWEYYEAIKSLSTSNGEHVMLKTHIPTKYVQMLYQMDDTLQKRWTHRRAI